MSNDVLKKVRLRMVIEGDYNIEVLRPDTPDDELIKVEKEILEAEPDLVFDMLENMELSIQMTD